MVDLHEHSIQTATRALKDGADEELVICALLHDIGELMTPICHGEIGKVHTGPYQPRQPAPSPVSQPHGPIGQLRQSVPPQPASPGRQPRPPCPSR